MSSDQAALSAAYWLHMLATVVWFGGLTSMAWLVLPAFRAVEAGHFSVALDLVSQKMEKRLQAASWFCLAVLAATGMFQMSANPHYQGFLTITDAWGVAVLLKHGLFALMTAVSAYLTWGLLPSLRRTRLRLAQGLAAPDYDRLVRRERWLLTANVWLAVLVLLCTALARAV